MKRNLFAFSSMLAGVLLLALGSCGEQAPQSENQAPALNNIDAYYNSAEADSIRVQLVTYIYKPPNKVPMGERFDPQYRGWFTEQMTKFQFLHFHVAEDGTHYFYMLRPARTVTNEKRGVAGQFKLDADKQVIEYFELFNTPMIPEETVISHGLAIFPELIETGDFASFKDKPEFIEFPNAQAKYDTEIYEWSYKIQ